MNDTIYRRDAIQALVDTEEIKGFVYKMLEDRLMEIPSADKPQGCWFYSWSIFSKGYECTNCHKKAIAEYDYCPNCGCYMKGVDE